MTGWDLLRGAPTNATGTENTGTSIEAGRYISKRVYIEAKQSTTGTSQLEADVDLTKRLKLQNQAGKRNRNLFKARRLRMIQEAASA